MRQCHFFLSAGLPLSAGTCEVLATKGYFSNFHVKSKTHAWSDCYYLVLSSKIVCIMLWRPQVFPLKTTALGIWYISIEFNEKKFILKLKAGRGAMTDLWIGLQCPSQINSFAIHLSIYLCIQLQARCWGRVFLFLAANSLWSPGSLVYEGYLRAYLMTTLANVVWYDMMSHCIWEAADFLYFDFLPLYNGSITRDI